MALNFLRRGGGPERGNGSGDVANFQARKAGLSKLPDTAQTDPDKGVVDYYSSGRDPLELVRTQLETQFTTAGVVDVARVDTVFGRITTAREAKPGNGIGQ